MTGYYLTIIRFVGSPALPDVQYIPFRLPLRGSSTWPRYGGHPWVLPIKACLCRHLLVRARLQRYSITVCRPIRAQASAKPSRAIPSPFFYPCLTDSPTVSRNLCIAAMYFHTYSRSQVTQAIRLARLHHHWQCSSRIHHRSMSGHRTREV